MKTLHYLILVGLMGLAVVVGSLASVANMRSHSAKSPEQTVEFRTDESDVWDATLAQEPPLAPGAAIRTAVGFMRVVQLPDYTTEWILDNLTLQRRSFSDGPEEWIYLVSFHASPQDKSDHSPVRFQVPVRFNGSVPEAFIANNPRVLRLFLHAQSTPAGDV